MKLNRSDLIDAGWSDDRQLDDVILYAENFQKEKGIQDDKYLLKLLRKKFPNSHAALRMREGELPKVTEAIDAEGVDEEKNLQKVRKQMRELMKSPVIQSGSIMPDACPAGNEYASMPVGSVVVTEGAIIPAAHSADICCSMYASFYRSDCELTDELDHLTDATRFGPGVRVKEVVHPVVDEAVWTNPFLRGLQPKARYHMADQGDGNHFAYLGEVDVTAKLLEQLEANAYHDMKNTLKEASGKLRVLVTHHGSRGLGSAVYKRGLEAAVKMTRKHAQDIPAEAAWLKYDSKEGKAYWDALQYIARWTRANHESIHQRFLQSIDSSAIYQMGNEHNFVWKRGDNFLHGKGATPAWKDDEGRALMGLIPLNMAEPILMVLGSDNETYSSFAPHGAGRNLSRRALVKKYKRRTGAEKGSLDHQAIEQEILNSTKGIEVRWYQGEPDLTEAPTAYKPAEKVIEQIEKYQLATVIAKIQPRGCMMAGRKPVQVEKPLSPKQIRQQQHRSERRKNNQRNWEQEGEANE